MTECELKRRKVIRLLRLFIHRFDGQDVEDEFVKDVLESAADMLEQDAHLEYEDLGIYYCGLHRIAGQLSPNDYCSRANSKRDKK